MRADSGARTVPSNLSESCQLTRPTRPAPRGTGLDLVVFGIIIGVMVGRVERKRQISSQQELIDDFSECEALHPVVSLDPDRT